MLVDPPNGRLPAPGARVTAVDFSDKMLERARRKVTDTDVHVIVHDLHEPEFVQRYPRAERYLGWPMLVVLELRAHRGDPARAKLQPPSGIAP